MTIRYSNIAVALLFLGLLAGAFFVPFGIVDAQQFPGDEGPSGIVPCGDPGEPSCNVCHLIDLSQDVINFGVYFTVFVATIAFIYAGFLYITAQGVPGKISAAHKIFQSVLVGMIIVLVSWLIVDTVMVTFFQGSDLQKGYGKPWEKILCDGTVSTRPSGSRSNAEQNQGTEGGITTATEPSRNICYTLTEQELGFDRSGNWTSDCSGSGTVCRRRQVAVSGQTYDSESECSTQCSGTCSDPASLRENDPGTVVDPVIDAPASLREDNRTDEQRAEDADTLRQELIAWGGSIGVINQEVEVRNELLGYGITVNKGPCANEQRYQDRNGGCTNTRDFTEATTEAVITVASECNCDIVVTGGSEAGHAGGIAPGTHGGGEKFNLRPTPELNRYLDSPKFEFATVDGRAGLRDTTTGDFWVRENEGGSNDHWDVVVNQ